jgi:hypothetical protein
MQLKPGLRAVRRDDTESQIGLDPRLRAIIRLSDFREHAVLQALESDRTLPQLRAILRQSGANPERADALVRDLIAAGVLKAVSQRPDVFAVGPERRAAFAPTAETRALVTDGDGWEGLAQMAKATVDVFGLGRTGAHVAAALAGAGVGRIGLTDTAPVTSRDTGAHYRGHDEGARRDRALAEHLRPFAERIRLRPRRKDPAPAAAVLVDYLVTDLDRSTDLGRRDIPHLLVTIGEASVQVGPWVMPGVTACARCQSLDETDQDPFWPVMAAQFAANGRFAERGEDPALAAVAGAFAAAQLTAVLSGIEPVCARMVYTIWLPAFEITARPTAPHAECGCDGTPMAIGDVGVAGPA